MVEIIYERVVQIRYFQYGSPHVICCVRIQFNSVQCFTCSGILLRKMSVVICSDKKVYSCRESSC